MQAGISAEHRSDPLSAPPSGVPGERPRPSRARPWLPPLALLVAAWAVPLATYVVHAAWLLPPVVLLGTASLLRGGRTLLDRLVLAVGLLAGTTCAAGLLFSVWPWGLHPVPVAGTALSVLVVVGVLARRRPTLPRPGFADLFSAVAALALTGYLASPYLRASGFTGRLGFAMIGQDNSRHLAVFDAIGRLGGYLFADQAASRDQVFSGLIYYPQGWHLTTALLDGFVRRPAGVPGGTAVMDHYLFWSLATIGLLMLVLVWAAQWIAGRSHPLRLLVLVGAVGALALGTELPRLLVYGYPSETLGLILAVLVAALVVRPVAGTREQLTLLGALLIGLGFAYYLFLFPAGALVLLYLVLDRRRVAARRGTLVVVALLTAALAPLTALSGLLFAGQSEALTAEGGGIGTTYDTLLGLGAVVVAGVVARSGWAEELWRRYLAVLVPVLGFAFAIAAVNVLHQGIQPGYYFVKAVHLCTALLIVGVAALVRLLPVPDPAPDPAPAGRGALARAWAQPVALAALVTLATFTASGVTSWTGGFFHIQNSAGGTTWARRWVTGDFQRAAMARVVAAAAARYPALPGTVTLIVAKTAYDGCIESMFLSALQGTTAQTERGIYAMPLVDPEQTRLILLRNDSVRLIVADPAGRAALDQVLATSPELAAKVTAVPLVP